MNVKNTSGIEYTFKIVANHACPLYDGQYTLLGTRKNEFLSLCEAKESFWIIGKIEEPQRKFRKVSVVRMADKEESERLESLDIYRYTKTFLLCCV